MLQFFCKIFSHFPLVALRTVELLGVCVRGEAGLGHRDALPGQHGLVDDCGAGEEDGVTAHAAPRGGDHYHVPRHQLAVPDLHLDNSN